MDQVLRQADLPLHPGELLREDVMPALHQARITKVRFAQLLGMTTTNLDNILACRQAITPPIAARLGALQIGVGEDWLGWQLAYDLAVARARIGADALGQLPDLSALQLAA